MLGWLTFVAASFENLIRLALHALLCDYVEQGWALDAFGAVPEGFVGFTEDLALVLLYVIVPILVC